jgi:uncharacterized membrane protein YfcA
MFYAWEGYVDIRLSMIILAGSLFGVQIGAIGTTYVKEYTVKLVMGTIMLIVLFSRLVKVPVYLSEMGKIEELPNRAIEVLSQLSFATLIFALLAGALIILVSLTKGILEQRKRHKAYPEAAVVD